MENGREQEKYKRNESKCGGYAVIHYTTTK